MGTGWVSIPELEHCQRWTGFFAQGLVDFVFTYTMVEFSLCLWLENQCEFLSLVLYNLFLLHFQGEVVSLTRSGCRNEVYSFQSHLGNRF